MSLQRYARQCLADIYAHVGWDLHTGEHLMRSLQGQILPLACRLDVGDCVIQAQHRFAMWKLDHRRL